jgi:atypical dual specificity phosphatase
MLGFGRLEEALRHGIGGVVNMMDEYTGPEKTYKKHGVEQLRLPTVDHCEPCLDDLRQAVAFISRIRCEGQSVLVHCKSGKGRSAAVAMCWLMKAKGMNPKTAQRWLLARRNVRPKLCHQPNVLAFYKELCVAESVPQ